MKRYTSLAIILAAVITASFTGCGALGYLSADETAASGSSESPISAIFTSADVTVSSSSASSSASAASYTAASGGVLDGSGMFTDRDLKQSADTSEATYIKVSDGETVDITEEGVYVISGSAKDCTIRVEAPSDAKVQLVLSGLTIENADFPAIYVVSADKVFITSQGENSLTVTGQFTADGDTNTDAVIFSRDDITLCGDGSLEIVSSYGNGISGKDDIKITGGVYTIRSALDGIEANDSIRVCGGDISITTSKDGFHAENDEDNSLGYIYIAGGTITIKAADDAIHATTVVQIDGGELDLTGAEGIEGTYIQINGGVIDITASDDGVNAAYKSKSYTPTFEMNDGELTVAVGQGDTDAIDSNGEIIVNGGTINITAQMSSFDYDGKATYNGGTIIINGQQVDSIPQSMMGGGMGGFGGGGFGGWGGNAGGNNGGWGGSFGGGFGWGRG